MLAPGVATMSASNIMKHEATGVTYMDTVTTSVGRVALSGPEQETLAQGPTIQDITDLVYRSNQITTFGWWGEPITAYGQINLPMTAFGWKEYNAIGK